MKTKAVRCHACGLRVAPENYDWLRFRTATGAEMHFCSIDHMKASLNGKGTTARLWKPMRFWMLRDWPSLFYRYDD
ncbi:50S ribosomal subunit [Yaravirus sp. 'brasiliensis']|uniref:50S ribosomal subunit n=1 Tax=Yaravirus sp. 'brasiliensis' TaxID=2739681 RepID=A0AAE7B7E3_9VIRU|nr:50S ribosomal subunit [Yaravirus brasiliensis]QKE44427.1 50S ribosomal subunit [Yaravirus brasiliensis]